ncbi:hypothetical protein OK016_18390 [Vibrio chagasii]|nr:hypothetical protein [Vibrio chagasii]
MNLTPLATSARARIYNSSVSFIDQIDGHLDMGEYLAENAYGFLTIRPDFGSQSQRLATVVVSPVSSFMNQKNRKHT